MHPARDKVCGEVHQTGNGREELQHLQRERIAMLEGFDGKRSGLEGHWLAYKALLQVKREPGGKLRATGWKWEQADWKMRCEYEMSGVVTGGISVGRAPAQSGYVRTRARKLARQSRGRRMGEGARRAQRYAERRRAEVHPPVWQLVDRAALPGPAVARHQHQGVDPVNAYAAATFAAGRGS
jgi:hypothetical protein